MLYKDLNTLIYLYFVHILYQFKYKQIFAHNIPKKTAIVIFIPQSFCESYQSKLSEMKEIKRNTHTHKIFYKIF